MKISAGRSALGSSRLGAPATAVRCARRRCLPFPICKQTWRGRSTSLRRGTRWGGGMWISSYDMARFGLLWQRNGKWGSKQIVSPEYIKMATTASAHGPDYGFLWWLNTTGKQYPGSPITTYEARGQGGNVIHIDAPHDLVVVWRWSAQSAEGFKRVLDAITS